VRGSKRRKTSHYDDEEEDDFIDDALIDEIPRQRSSRSTSDDLELFDEPSQPEEASTTVKIRKGLVLSDDEN